MHTHEAYASCACVHLLTWHNLLRKSPLRKQHHITCDKAQEAGVRLLHSLTLTPLPCACFCPFRVSAARLNTTQYNRHNAQQHVIQQRQQQRLRQRWAPPRRPVPPPIRSPGEISPCRFQVRMSWPDLRLLHSLQSAKPRRPTPWAATRPSRRAAPCSSPTIPALSSPQVSKPLAAQRVARRAVS